VALLAEHSEPLTVYLPRICATRASSVNSDLTWKIPTRQILLLLPGISRHLLEEKLASLSILAKDASLHHCALDTGKTTGYTSLGRSENRFVDHV
jgi:hypothetical protein